MIIKSLSGDLDIRDRWLGIRSLKTDFKPQPYHRKDAQGNPISADQIANEFAKHLAEKIWKSTSTPVDNISRDKVLGTRDKPPRAHKAK